MIEATITSGHPVPEIQRVDYFAANHKLLDGLRRAGMPAE
jgi:hypothetical protein